MYINLNAIGVQKGIFQFRYDMDVYVVYLTT